MAVFHGFVWLIFSTAFNGYLQISPSSQNNKLNKLKFIQNCTDLALFDLQSANCTGTSGSMDSQSVHYFESAFRPGKFLSRRCGNVSLRSEHRRLNNAFRLVKVPGSADEVQLVHNKTNAVLVVNGNGYGEFHDQTMVNASLDLQRMSPLKVITIVKPPRGQSACSLYCQHARNGGQAIPPGTTC